MTELRAEIQTKTHAPIYNSHRDSRDVIYFLAELYLGDVLVCDSGIWSGTEQGAIQSALGNIRVGETIRTDYERYDFDPQLDGWLQCHVHDAETRERLKKVYEEIAVFDESV